MGDENELSKPKVAVATVLASTAAVVLIIASSFGCWYVWDKALDHYEGQCVGPFCIQSDATTEGTSDLEH